MKIQGAIEKIIEEFKTEINNEELLRKILTKFLKIYKTPYGTINLNKLK